MILQCFYISQPKLKLAFEETVNRKVHKSYMFLNSTQNPPKLWPETSQIKTPCRGEPEPAGTYRQPLAVEEHFDSLGGASDVVRSPGQQSHRVFVQDGHLKLGQVRPEGDAGVLLSIERFDAGVSRSAHVVVPGLCSQRADVKLNFLFLEKNKTDKYNSQLLPPACTPSWTPYKQSPRWTLYWRYCKVWRRIRYGHLHENKEEIIFRHYCFSKNFMLEINQWTT